MNYSLMTEREVEIELSTSASEGLESFAAHDRLIDNGRNMPEKTYTKSIATVILMQLTNLYTIAFMVMGVISALCDFKGSMVAWIIFFAVATLNMVSGFLHDYADRKVAVEFDSRRTDEVNIIRDATPMSTDPTLLVKGDIVVLKQGDFVPADIRILKCEALKADESIFKGRNVPVDKVSEKCEEETDAAECNNILYCGSLIASGECVGAVIATGKDTSLARVRASKSRKLDMHDKFGKNAKSEKLLVIAALIAAAVTLVVTAVGTKSFSMAMLQACTVALCLLPAPVCIVRMIGVAVCAKRLRADGVCSEQADFVYDIGTSQYFLFDKGGLLTNNETSLEEKVMADETKLNMAVICSDCECVGGFLSGNELDKATARALIEKGIDVEAVLKNNEKIKFMPFDEKRMLMATLTKSTTGYTLIVKGYVEAVPMLCTKLCDEDGVRSMTGEILHRLESVSSSMAEKGLKVRVVAYKELDYILENIEEEIKALTFVGILGYREPLARKARESVKNIERVFVKPVMVTGDHIITAATFARSAGLIKKETECVSFHELTDCSNEELLEAVDKYKVFASATSADRERMVRVLTENGKRVVVAGEQMTAPSVALYANASFGDETMEDCDVIVKKSDIENVAEVIYKSRCTRGNLAYASLLAISTGLCEVLVMLFMLMTGALLPTASEMLLTNMFIVFVPALCVSVFAAVHQRQDTQDLLALNCVLRGVICALFALAAKDMIAFVVLYSILDAILACASYNNFEKGRLGIWGILALAVVFIGANVFMGFNGAVVVCALIAAILNALLPHINLKGLRK
ncbi:MAG: cation-transporting P-type ATPase [Clostridia bacterium]|nr:cation-transporting P-type ATPase [Clostridia bacterium]